MPGERETNPSVAVRWPSMARRRKRAAQRSHIGRLVSRWWRARPPRAAWLLVAVAAIAVADVAYQLAHKPTDVLGLVVPTSTKTPETTWSEYGRFFDAHSTDVARPELLAALVQVESGGDPLARTYWRWRWRWNPLDVYAPASSAVGIMQITDGTFAEARRLCIHDHTVAHQGAWNDPRACWFNALYSRTVPSNAIEMTAANLHEAVTESLAAQRNTRATLEQKQRLAAVIHLCGRERGAAYARRGFWALPGERCGDHDVALYLARVEALRKAFARMGSAVR